ncbi:MAG: copper resistance protein CopC [Actinomycetota bacterium]|nr:copper resistance protein CopC [Actinomycetota bacterium]
MKKHGIFARLAGFTAIIALSVLGILGFGAASAQAHTELISSTPANGAVLDAAPASVTFFFEEALIPDLDTVSINDEKGLNISSQKVTPTGDQLSIPWPVGLPAGKYQVAYRVVSEDGHPVNNSITFEYGGAVPVPTASPALVSNTDVESSAAVLLIVAGVGLLAISIAVIYVLMKRRG